MLDATKDWPARFAAMARESARETVETDHPAAYGLLGNYDKNATKLLCESMKILNRWNREIIEQFSDALTARDEDEEYFALENIVILAQRRMEEIEREAA